MGKNSLDPLPHRTCVRFLFLTGLLILAVLPTQELRAQSPSHSSIAKLIRQNRLAEAEQRLWSILAQQPDQAWALDLMAGIRMRQKRMQEAQALFRKALTLDVNDVQAFRGLGELYGTLGNTAEAIDSYSHVIAITPSDIAANSALATLYEGSGHYKESIVAVERIPVTLRSPELLPVLAADYFGAGDPSKVPALILFVVRQANSAPKALLDFVTVLIRNGYVSDAEHVVEMVKPIKPSVNYLHAASRVRAAQGKPQEALQLLSQALTLQPKSFDLLFDAARLEAQANHWREVIDFLRRADEIHPDRPEVLLKLSLALLKGGRRAQAVAAARRLYSIQPDDPDNEYVFAFTLVEDDLPQEAEPIARKLAAARPNDVNSQLLLAIAEFKTSDTVAAKQQLQRCLAIDPHSAEAHYYSGLIARREGNVGAARLELEEAVRTNPEHAVAQAELGTLYLQTGNLESAKTALEQAVKVAPGISQYHYHLGLVYGRLGRQDAAQAEMQTYQKLHQAEDEEQRRRGNRSPSGTTPQP